MSEIVCAIRPLQNELDRKAFRLLNEEWISTYFALEENDRKVLGRPDAEILDKGGRIYVADHRGEVVGCVALIPIGGGIYELSKMAVSPRHQGFGIGRRLLEHAILEARALGALSLFLGSNTRLESAVHLYESVGFRHVPLEQIGPLPYVRANVFMNLPLL